MLPAACSTERTLGSLASVRRAMQHIRMKVFRVLALSAALFLPSLAHALEPVQKNNYINFHAQALSLTSGLGVLGVAVDWGAFQNRYVAAGTRFGFSRTTIGTESFGALEFGGGPQFHIPVGERLLIVPAINLGYRLSTADIGLSLNLSTAVAYRLDSFFLGGEFEMPVWVQNAPEFFPGFTTPYAGSANTLNAFIGFYY